MSTVELPAMRLQVRAALRALANPTYQSARWGLMEPGVNYYDDLSINVHVLYDDCEVLPEPSRTIGTVLYEDEVPAFRTLESSLGPLLEELGDSPDETYLTDPRWPAVVRSAKRALEAMATPE
jgi:hypothetical protein